MKQLLILSGKGGTGKTTIASAFIALSNAKAYADCDVDAPNLHLIKKQDIKPKRADFLGMKKAQIDEKVCINCDKCRISCSFDAVKLDQNHSIDIFACEGCGVCEVVCPVKAISLKDNKAGDLILYKNSDEVFSTAQLKMGSGTSGMLVTEVKKQMKSTAIKSDLAIIDGSPGIGCPVIASLSGVDMVLIVAEPSVSGMSDMLRIKKTAEKFNVEIAICVNKFDVNLNLTKNIEKFCEENCLPFVGSVPFDLNAVKAINSGKTVVEIDCESGKAIRSVYEKTMNLLFGDRENRD